MVLSLVMIPAFGCDHGLYEEVVEALLPLVRVQTIIGTSDRFSGMVDQVLGVAPEQFVVLGTSMGGRLALEVALAAPKRVQGLVVIGAGAGAVADPAAGLRRSARLRSGEMDAVLSEMGDIIAHLPGPRGTATRDAFISMGRATGADIMARQSDALAHREDRWERLPEISCPTLCLWGRYDKFSLAAEGMKMAELLPRGRYVELPECGHFPTLEYPEESSKVIAEWLRGERLSPPLEEG